jgi:hypothetical protein
VARVGSLAERGRAVDALSHWSRRKNEQIFLGFLCRLRKEETTLLLKSVLSVTTIRPTVSVFRCFHTSSSGLRSGEYGGRITAGNTLGGPNFRLFF